MRVIMMQENVEFDNGKNEGDEITSFAEEEVCLNYLHNHDGLIIISIIMTVNHHHHDNNHDSHHNNNHNYPHHCR